MVNAAEYWLMVLGRDYVLDSGRMHDGDPDMPRVEAVQLVPNGCCQTPVVSGRYLYEIRISCVKLNCLGLMLDVSLQEI